MTRNAGWLKPRLSTGTVHEPADMPDRRQYKVIRINWVWDEGNHEAVHWVEENDPMPEVIFAVEEKPKGWWKQLAKQLFG